MRSIPVGGGCCTYHRNHHCGAALAAQAPCPVLAPQGGDWTSLEQSQERLGQPGEGSGLGKNSICKNPQLEMERCARPSLFVPREHIRATGTNQSTTNSIPSNIRKPPAFLCLTIKFYSLFFFFWFWKFSSILHTVIVCPGLANKARWKTHERRWRDIDLGFRPIELSEQKDKCS